MYIVNLQEAGDPDLQIGEVTAHRAVAAKELRAEGDVPHECAAMDIPSLPANRLCCWLPILTHMVCCDNGDTTLIYCEMKIDPRKLKQQRIKVSSVPDLMYLMRQRSSEIFVN